MLFSLKDLIEKSINRAGISNQVTASRIVRTVEDFLDLAVEQNLRSSISVISFKNDVIKIHCHNSVAAHEVSSLEPGIIDAVVTIAPKTNVRRILIQIHSKREI